MIKGIDECINKCQMGLCERSVQQRRGHKQAVHHGRIMCVLVPLTAPRSASERHSLVARLSDPQPVVTQQMRQTDRAIFRCGGPDVIAGNTESPLLSLLFGNYGTVLLTAWLCGVTITLGIRLSYCPSLSIHSFLCNFFLLLCSVLLSHTSVFFPLSLISFPSF